MMNRSDQEPMATNDDNLDDDPFAPRPRNRRPRRRILGPWARLTLVGLGLLVVGMALGALVGKIARPHQEVTALQSQLDSVNGQLAQKNAENADYRRRIAYVNTPEGVATEARQYGYVKPHEVPVVVADSVPVWSAPAPLPQAAPPAPSFSERIVGLWDRIIGRR
jgi:hypothetical protein